MTPKALNELQKQVVAILGEKPESVGKTQARQNFLPLVDALSQTGTAIEITDHDKPVAVLLSYSHWLAIIAKLTMLSKNDQVSLPLNLVGSIQITGDLAAGSKKAAAFFSQSLQKTVNKL
ncbi:hypothetical protein BH11CYA1_BH11CYA1_00360 [soil metagenome]